MAIMDYVTPGITKIDFEGNIFVTTGLNKKEKEAVHAYIESKNGLVKGSVTKKTKYLIYSKVEGSLTRSDTAKDSAPYQKAMELAESQDIAILPLSLFKVLCRGEGITVFGSYPSENGKKPMPIQWSILAREGSKALLLSTHGLDVKPYNKKDAAVTWETCTLRKWLNEDFFKTAFSEEEKSKIQLSHLKNTENPEYHTPGGNDTDDRIFLLSASEAEQYLVPFERQLVKTTYAFNINNFTGIQCDWWLRSPGFEPDCADHVWGDGTIPKGGYYVNATHHSVCPAMWVDLG